MGGDALMEVDWNLPGMEEFHPDLIRWFHILVNKGEVSCSIDAGGWAFLPSSDGGFFNEYSLLGLGKFIKILNDKLHEGYV